MFDFVVLGSGFSGSLMASILARQGRSVLMIDRGRHPRFTIGESSTPAGNLILRHLAKQYDLPMLTALSRWGSWKQTYREIDCGLKRGFSYYFHTPHHPFSNEQNDNCLLVAASSSDEVGDTQWYRPHVDQLFAEMAEDAGVAHWQQTKVEHLHRSSHHWQLEVLRNGKCKTVEARFLIDATGSDSGLVKELSLPRTNLHTNSWGVFSHFDNVPPWRSVMKDLDVELDHHPFATDRSALHHVFPGGWMWQLRFDSETLSAGFVLNGNIESSNGTPEQIWQQQLVRFPTLQQQFANAQLASVPGRMIKSGRLQRRVRRPAGDNWLLLPSTAGFVDPLHSTGIAQSLAGIEFCLDSFAQCAFRPWGHPRWDESTNLYTARLAAEFDLIDKLVDGAYRLNSNARKFVSYCMVYFAAATSYEILREDFGRPPTEGFLMSQCPVFNAIVDRLYDTASLTLDDEQFEQLVATELKPFNRVGLCDPSLNNMYAYTAHE